MKKSLLSFAAIAMLFVSCTDKGQNPIEPGNGEITNVSFALGNTMTRTINPETELKEANFYVFESGTLLLLETIKVTPNTSGKMQASSGPKEVLIVANYEANKGTLEPLPTFTPGTSIATVEAALEAMNVTNAALATPASGLNYSNIDTDDTKGTGFVMSSRTVLDFPAGGTEADPIEVHAPIYRVASKLLVGVDEDVINLSDIRKKIPGEISNSMFAVVNTSMATSLGRTYFVGGGSPINSTDGAVLTSGIPEYSFVPSVENPENVSGSTSYDHLFGYEEMVDASVPSTYVGAAWKATVLDATATGLAITAPHFLPENIVKGMAVGEAANGEVTYATVKVQYTPAATEIDKGYTPAATFYARRHIIDGTLFKNGDIVFYTIENDAVTAQPSADYETIEYKSGLMYYRVNLSNVKYSETVEKYSVLRNSNYLMDINNINDYGKHSVEELPGEPDEPVEENTAIEVIIKVIDYTIIASNPDLG